MSQLKYSVEDYEYGLEIKARWSPIVQAAGLYSPKQTAESIFLLAGTIIDDVVYTQRLTTALLTTTTADGGPADALEIGPAVLHSMTEADRAALRSRVLAHWGKK